MMQKTSEKHKGIAVVAVLAMVSSACGVPIRYAVPSQELYGRELIGQQVDLLDDGETETRGVVAVETPGLKRFGDRDPKANASLQALLPSLEGQDVLVEVDDTRVWPSIVGALILGQVGMLVGEVYGISTLSDSRNETRDMLLAITAGTVSGAAVGAALGSMFAGSVKSRHLAPLPPPPELVPSSVPPPAAATAVDPQLQ